MVRITKDDVLKVARLSHIDIHDDEIDVIAAQLQSILSYASRVQEIAQDYDTLKHYNQLTTESITKSDTVIKTDSEPILEAAPEREGSYFVVPVIIEVSQ